MWAAFSPLELAAPCLMFLSNFHFKFDNKYEFWVYCVFGCSCSAVWDDVTTAYRLLCSNSHLGGVIWNLWKALMCCNKRLFVRQRCAPEWKQAFFVGTNVEKPAAAFWLEVCMAQHRQHVNLKCEFGSRLIILWSVLSVFQIESLAFWLAGGFYVWVNTYKHKCFTLWPRICLACRKTKLRVQFGTDWKCSLKFCNSDDILHKLLMKLR